MTYENIEALQNFDSAFKMCEDLIQTYKSNNDNIILINPDDIINNIKSLEDMVYSGIVKTFLDAVSIPQAGITEENILQISPILKKWNSFYGQYTEEVYNEFKNDLSDFSKNNPNWYQDGTLLISILTDYVYKPFEKYVNGMKPYIAELMNILEIRNKRYQTMESPKQINNNEYNPVQIFLNKENAIQYAEYLTREKEKIRNELISLLKNSEHKPISFGWNQYRKHGYFSEPCPKELDMKKYPDEINEKDYEVALNLYHRIFRKRYKKKIEDLKQQYEKAIESRKEEIIRIDLANTNCRNENQKLIDLWKTKKENFETVHKKHNTYIDSLESSFSMNEQKGVEFYFNEILKKIKLPAQVSISWELQYNSDSKIMILDCNVPSKDIIPKTKDIKYITTRKEFKECNLKDKEIDQNYDELLYQLALRISNDLYVSDINNQIKSIVYNGFFTGINKSNGKEETKCIMSLQTMKTEFLEINIENVDAKSCFLRFKGILGSKLSEFVPIAPIINLNKEDSRFVSGKDVSNKVNGMNLAAMDWEDFEHLIRLLFEKEFSANGSEIKITQASRDGGVDAIMFDPDPIRGGKYVIQAKRYTNVVGVSAVRDLYGTLLNEGAVKGILVTTANYGADSYEFAKDKPITLIDGNNLLHMLQKHGYQARIDINEARKMLHED